MHVHAIQYSLHFKKSQENYMHSLNSASRHTALADKKYKKEKRTDVFLAGYYKTSLNK